LRGALVLSVAALSAAPWLRQDLVWCGWLGTAAALLLTTHMNGWVAFCCTASWSFIAIATAFHWAPDVLAYMMKSSYSLGVLTFVPLVMWEGARVTLTYALAGRLASNASSLWLPAGLLAVIVESIFPSLFPWKLGYCQIAWPWTIQAVDVFGPEWSTFMVFAYAGAILSVGRAACAAAAVRRLAGLPLRLAKSLPLWLCIANSLYGCVSLAYWQRQIAAAPSLRVALIQVDPSFVESAADVQRLTKAVGQKVDLVCWPESSAGTYARALQGFSDPLRVFELSKDPERGLRPWEKPDCPLLLGAHTYGADGDPPVDLQQTAILLDCQERIIGRYQKRILMPFGEYLPGQGWIPGIDRLFPVPDPMLAGSEATVLQTDKGVKLGVMLCYEDMAPECARSLTQESAEVLVCLINASDLQSPLALAQHRLLAQLRAVECRRYLLRCASTGETCVISPLGTIEARLPVQTQGTLTAQVPLFDAETPYCKLGGSFFPLLCCVGIGLYLGSKNSRLIRSIRRMRICR
jgi:apolipoprotein N-acyltransferase